MSGGSQHNPNGRQAQLGAGWSPLQVANFLARAPQAHMAERGHTWHTPTPPPHLYHVPAPSPPDPLQALLLQAMKASGNSVFRHTATPPELYRHTPTPPDKHLMSGMREEERGKPMKPGSNSVFRHTATPPELYRHTPTPPDKHLMRHTPSPGDAKAGAALPPAEMYPHLGPGRDKLMRPEELLYARGVDLSVSARGANGAPPPPAAHQPPPAAHQPHPAPAPPAAPALSVRDAPTINSLIARHQPRPGHARVDALLERLSSPASPHSVIVHPRAAPTPSPPSSNEDSADSCGAPPGSKRKRKPERTVRMPTALNPAPTLAPLPAHARLTPPPPHHAAILPRTGAGLLENGEHHGTEIKSETQDAADAEDDTKPTDMEIEDTQIPQKPPTPEPHARRKEKTRSNSSETIDDIAAMVACDKPLEPPPLQDKVDHDEEVPETIDQLKSVLASPRHEESKEPTVDKIEEPKISPPRTEEKEKEVEKPPEPVVEAPTVTAASAPAPAPAPAAPKRRSTRTSNSETTNVPVESPSEGKPAEPEEGRSATPTAASFVEVENQLEMMFAGIEEESPVDNKEVEQSNKPKKRRKSAPTKAETKPGRRTVRANTTDRRRGGKKRGGNKQKKQKDPPKETVKDAYSYDSGSNASSSRSRGPYIQIRGPRDSPLSVSVINASTGEDETEAVTARRKPNDYRNGLRARGLHASTLGLRYDATTPDLTWTCAFCESGPHAAALGDLFGPYTVDTDCDEYKALDEASRQRYEAAPSPAEVWFHEACAVWAPGLVAAGARLWGLAPAVWGARGARCAACGKPGAGIACHHRGCRGRTHVPCAKNTHWVLDEEEFKAYCPRHSALPAAPSAAAPTALA